MMPLIHSHEIHCIVTCTVQDSLIEFCPRILGFLCLLMFDVLNALSTKVY